MIKVVCGNNLNRESYLVPEDSTPRAALENAGVDYTKGTTHLDGVSMKVGDFDKTFAELGVTEKCFLLNVVKVDNAR